MVVPHSRNKGLRGVMRNCEINNNTSLMGVVLEVQPTSNSCQSNDNTIFPSLILFKKKERGRGDSF